MPNVLLAEKRNDIPQLLPLKKKKKKEEEKNCPTNKQRKQATHAL